MAAKAMESTLVRVRKQCKYTFGSQSLILVKKKILYVILFKQNLIYRKEIGL